MEIIYNDMHDGFMFSSAGEGSGCDGYVSLKTGEVFCHSSENFSSDDEEEPHYFYDDDCIHIPDKRTLGLGTSMVFDFANAYLSERERERISGIFRKRGAYSRFKSYLRDIDKLDAWHAYENNAEQEALIEWCQEHNIKLKEIPALKELPQNGRASLSEDVQKDYTQASDIINWQHPEIMACSRTLAKDCPSEIEYIRRAFVFVRDTIQHSWDHQVDVVTCIASDVLAKKTGYCYAKSHLLAALLRAQEIPAGLCYQRLSLNGDGAPYSLHGLNAVFLADHGWYRIDARGNTKSVNAQFSPPQEKLAFAITDTQERDLPEIWSEPLSVVVTVLQKYDSIQDLHKNLPDIQILS